VHRSSISLSTTTSKQKRETGRAIMEVIGISRALIEALVEKAKSAMKEEAEQWQTLEREIVFIMDEFEMMKSFLNTADGEHMKNQVARTWVGVTP